MNNQTTRIGATRDEWSHFDLVLGVGSALLPVVANQKATISDRSSLKKIGKTPSKYNKEGHISGFTEWPKRHATDKDISDWSDQPDYGICVITRQIRGIDADINDPVLSAEVQAFIADHLGIKLPKRYRSNSAKFLHPFRMATDDPKFGKWVIYLNTRAEVESGIKNEIEFLMTGFQFVAAGTHESGSRIQWEGGLPADIPELNTGQFEGLFDALQQRFGARPPHRKDVPVERTAGDTTGIDDPVVSFMKDKGLVLGTTSKGFIIVECPNVGEHTIDEFHPDTTGTDSTVYVPKGLNGDPAPGFDCRHLHCGHLKPIDFYRHIGFVEESTADGFDDESLVEQNERRLLQIAQNRVIGEGDDFCALPEVLSVSDMLERFVFLSDGSQVFDTLHPKHTIAISDFRNATAASFTNKATGEFGKDGKPKTKRLQHAQLWVADKKRLTAIGTTFHAGAGRFVSDPKGRDCVNTWTGFRLVDAPVGDASIILDHIQWLFKDRTGDYLDWLAHIVQRPGVLPHTSWLHIASHTGIGRNAMSGVLARVFSGYAALCVSLESMLATGFNDELAGKVLAVVDEIRTGGREQWNHAEKFKQLITEAHRHINPKFGRKSLEFNACRWLIFSNHRDALPLDDSDRRVEVVISDEPPKDPDYYTRLYGVLDDEHKPVIAAFAKFLTERDISAFNPGKRAVRSDDKLQVIEVNRSSAQADLVDFTDSYPCELATADRLQRAAGMQGFGSEGAKFRHAAQNANWESMGRVYVKGKQCRLYARREKVGYWRLHKTTVEGALPVCDGGEIDWSDPTDPNF